MSTSSSIPGSPATTGSYNYNSKMEMRSEDSDITDVTNSNIMQDLRHQVFKGQLYKFTNVVKGWQYRWFELHPETGQLEYYYYEDHGLQDFQDLVSGKDRQKKIGNKGKKEHLAGAVVVPSEEDSQTFNVNFASGESYKLRAPNVRERQIWVDRLRAVSQLHDRAIAHSNPPVGKNVLLNRHKSEAPPPGSKSQLTKKGKPSDALQNLSLSALDAFGSVHDILYQAKLKHQNLSDAICVLPMQGQSTKIIDKLEGPFCHDDELLLMKATSVSAFKSMEDSLALLQDIREYQCGRQCRKNEIKNVKKGLVDVQNSFQNSKIGGLLSAMSVSSLAKNSAHSTVSSNKGCIIANNNKSKSSFSLKTEGARKESSFVISSTSTL